MDVRLEGPRKSTVHSRMSVSEVRSSHLVTGTRCLVGVKTKSVHWVPKSDGVVLRMGCPIEIPVRVRFD